MDGPAGALPGVRLTPSVALVLCVVTVAVAGCGGDAAGPRTSTAPPPTSSVADRAAESGRLLAAFDATQPGCSAAVAVEGRVLWTGVWGMADVAAGVAITTNTVFDIASISKQFTAGAILLLAAEGRLKLTDLVATHLTGLPSWVAELAIAELMHHVSGIPDIYDVLSTAGVAQTTPLTQEQAIAYLATTTPGPQRGTFSYSNSNYLLLADIVRVVSGTPLPGVLAERFFGPLGLGMILEPVRPVPGKARSYLREEKAPTTVTLSEITQWEFYGAGGIETTASELVRWADNYRTGAVGGQPFLDAQLADPVAAGANRYGAGIIIGRKGELRHGGYWDGFTSEFAVSGDRRTAMAALCNATLPPAQSNTLAALQRIWM